MLSVPSSAANLPMPYRDFAHESRHARLVRSCCVLHLLDRRLRGRTRCFKQSSAEPKPDPKPEPQCHER